MLYLASFKWPDHDEPLCCGTNKRKILRHAYSKAKEIYGTGLVNRYSALCSYKITYDDIFIQEIELLQK